MYIYIATYEGVGDALEEHHNTSPDCTIVTLNSSLYLDYFAHLINQNFARRLSYTCTMKLKFFINITHGLNINFP